MKRSRSLAAFTRTKRRLIVTVATAAVLLISSCAAVAMVQFYQADDQALEQRGATRKTLDSFRALSTADGLFDMPELDTRTLRNHESTPPTWCLRWRARIMTRYLLNALWIPYTLMPRMNGIRLP